MSWFKLWMFLHIMAAIVAFGPTFVFPMIAAAGRRDPRHAPFASAVSMAISERVTLPLAATMAASGIGLIVTGRIDFFGSAWLVASVALYVLALVYSFFVQRPTGLRMLEVLRSVPPGPRPEGQGPPPELATVGRRMKIGGMLLTLAVIAITLLMVWQPGGTSLR